MKVEALIGFLSKQTDTEVSEVEKFLADESIDILDRHKVIPNPMYLLKKYESNLSNSIDDSEN